MQRLALTVVACFLAGFAASSAITSTSAAAQAAGGGQAGGNQAKGESPMRLGNFSVSLAVKDLAASRAFYEKLGFKALPNIVAKNMVILQNETSTIGLFQGMFEKNTLTYNPGWDRNCATLPDFDDVREIQRRLKAQGLTLALAADDASIGPAGLMVVDPDGNPVLIDQHVPKPTK